jgi:hypothetical protein
MRGTLPIKDDTAEIHLYNIPNPHVQGFLLAHIVTGNILYVTDLISPRGPIERWPWERAMAVSASELTYDGVRAAQGRDTNKGGRT